MCRPNFRPMEDNATRIPVQIDPDREARRRVMEAARASGTLRTTPGPNASQSQDFLYDENGLPK